MKKLNVICYMLNDCLGQTMLEILVALTLIILFLSGIVVIELISIKNVEYAQKKSLATEYAQQQLERVRVVRDTAGIAQLENKCSATKCFINDKLTPRADITPTGVFVSEIRIMTPVPSIDCPPPSITPVPVVYKVNSKVSWSQGATNITPAQELTISSCITDWR